MDRKGTIDPIWEEQYARGHTQNYPWDVVVSFVYRHAPRKKPKQEIQVLEIGCGTGANLWFAAREGFSVHAIDASTSAINMAKERFTRESLHGHFSVADLTALPYGDDCFDLVIDRGSATCIPKKLMAPAIAGIHRVMKPAGRFLFTPYSDRILSVRASNGQAADTPGKREAGLRQRYGNLSFYNHDEVRSLLDQWRLLEFEEIVRHDHLTGGDISHSEWRLVAEKR